MLLSYFYEVKHLFFIFLVMWGTRLSAQPSLAYSELLDQTREIELGDSLRFDTSPESVSVIDSFSVKKWFSPLLSTTANNKFKNRSFSLAGKITRNNNFDLLVLMEEKRRSDSSGIQIIHLVSLKKDGVYIASLEAAVTGSKKKTDYNISSCLYKDYKIVLDSKITFTDKSLNDVTCYKINSGGRFILSPKFE